MQDFGGWNWIWFGLIVGALLALAWGVWKG
jgi:hypothetical protein